MDFHKDTYHKRSTYEELVLETIMSPTDKLELPDRTASQLRKYERLTRFDDDFLDIDDDNKKNDTQRNKQLASRTAVSNNTNNTPNVANNANTTNVTNNDNTTHTIQPLVQEKRDEDEARPPQAQQPPNPPLPPSKIYMSAANQTDYVPRFTTATGATSTSSSSM